MSRPRCFIIQETLKKDNSGNMSPVMDFRKVLDYGDPVILLPNGRIGFTPGPTVDTLRDKLRDYTDNDYIVSVGDPTAIFIAAMVVGELNNGKCNLLKWDKDSKQYICVHVDTYYRTRKEN